MAINAHLEHPANDAENRRYPRRSLYLETSGVIPGGGEANVTIHNLSVAGLLLETDAELVIGESLTVELPEIGTVAANVVWHSGDLYGCAFEQALSEGALAAASLRGTVVGSLDPVLPVGSLGIATQASQSAMISGRGEPFGVRLNRLRRERAMTLSDVAEALGVSKPTVWAWEKGKAKPIPERLDAIADALGVSPEELRVSGGNGDGAALVEECRLRIATTFGTDPQNVRIMIEV
ncbi:MAG: helix-turn-helix domain-containing protein [Pseudomonadota bacterium]